MGLWSDKAKGIYLDNVDTTVNEDLMKGNLDFIIAGMGTGTQIDYQISNHIQTAYNIGIPLLGYYRVDFDLYLGMGFDPNRWPVPDQDPQIKILDRALYSGTVRRIIHAIMIDVTDNITDGGQTVTDNWVRGIGQHMLDMVWNRYHLPIYLFVTSDLVSKYPGSEVLPTWLTRQEGISSWKSAYPNDPAVTMVDWKNIPVPAADYTPDYVYAPKVNFFRYSNTKFRFPGIVDKNGAPAPVPTWMYFGTRDALYNELGYVSPVTPTPTPNPTPTPTPVDLSGIQAQLTTISTTLTQMNTNLAQLNAISTNLNKLATHLGLNL